MRLNLVYELTKIAEVSKYIFLLALVSLLFILSIKVIIYKIKRKSEICKIVTRNTFILLFTIICSLSFYIISNILILILDNNKLINIKNIIRKYNNVYYLIIGAFIASITAFIFQVINDKRIAKKTIIKNAKFLYYDMYNIELNLLRYRKNNSNVKINILYNPDWRNNLMNIEKYLTLDYFILINDFYTFINSINNKYYNEVKNYISSFKSKYSELDKVRIDLLFISHGRNLFHKEIDKSINKILSLLLFYNIRKDIETFIVNELSNTDIEVESRVIDNKIKNTYDSISNDILLDVIHRTVRKSKKIELIWGCYSIINNNGE